MRFRVTTGGLAPLSLVVAAAVIAPADAALLCEGKPVTINLQPTPGKPATGGNDVIWGTPSADVISGLGGNDTICGNGGSDTLNGGSGNDVILPGLGDDLVKGGDGVDSVSYSDAPAAVYVLLGAPGYGQDTGGSGDDTIGGSIENLTGSPFNDSLFGTFGSNVLKGGAGDDFISPHQGADVINGGAGSDTATFADSSKGLTIDLAVTSAQATGHGSKTFGGVENIEGSIYPDQLRGSSASNELNGYSGKDLLEGRGGNDSLSGYGGADELRGGQGFDSCDGGFDEATDTQVGCEEFTGIP